MRIFMTTVRMIVAQIGVIGVGIWAESVAMQWFGFISFSRDVCEVIKRKYHDY